jgi:hypothetical protein
LKTRDADDDVTSLNRRQHRARGTRDSGHHRSVFRMAGLPRASQPPRAPVDLHDAQLFWCRTITQPGHWGHCISDRLSGLLLIVCRIPQCAVDPANRASWLTFKDVKYRVYWTELVTLTEDSDKLGTFISQTLLVMFCRKHTNHMLSPHPSQNAGCLIRSINTNPSYNEFTFVIRTTN